jgi:hypothetical protein
MNRAEVSLGVQAAFDEAIQRFTPVSERFPRVLGQINGEPSPDAWRNYLTVPMLEAGEVLRSLGDDSLAFILEQRSGGP